MTLLNTEIFKPLNTAAPSRPQDEFQVTVVTNPDEARPFVSLAEHPSAAGPGAPGQKNCEPRVSIQRDGNRITHIRVQCSCGQVMELACDYNEAENNP